MRVEAIERNTQNALKVIHVISGDLWAGAESQVFQMLVALHQYHPEIKIHCLLFNDGILTQRLREQGFCVTVIDETRYNVPSMFLRTMTFVKTVKPDILHCHHIKEHFLSFLVKTVAGLESPIVRTLHGLSKVPKYLKNSQRIRSSIVVGIDHLLVKMVTDMVIAVSKDLYRQTCAKHIRGSIRKIYNAIDTTQASLSSNGERCRQRYAVRNRLWIVTATRLVEPKNLDMLIDTGVVLRERGIDAKISVFGQGPLEEALNRRIRSLGLEDRVVLHGFTEQLHDILRAADVFVLCSRHEGLPMALIEAMSAEIPVVCTAVGGMQEVISDGENGLLVKLDDVPAMATAIHRLWVDKALGRKLSLNALNTVRKRFDVRKNVAALNQVYQDLCSGSRV